MVPSKKTYAPTEADLTDLTIEEAKLLIELKGGADIYNYHQAGVLRGIEKKRPRYIQITRPMMNNISKFDAAPFFGAITTKIGFAVARYVVKNQGKQ